MTVDLPVEAGPPGTFLHGASKKRIATSAKNVNRFFARVDVVSQLDAVSRIVVAC